MYRVIIHYRRTKKDYHGWGLHIWGTSMERTTWLQPIEPFGEDDFGILWVIRMAKGEEVLHYVIHRGDQKDSSNDQSIDINEKGREVWIIEGTGDPNPPQFTNEEAASEALLSRGLGDIRDKAQAYWLCADTIAWHIGFDFRNIHQLHYTPDGGMEPTPEGLTKGEVIPLVLGDKTLPPDLTEKYPHLRHAVILKIPYEYLARVPEILKGQFIVSIMSPQRELLGVAALQISGVLDDLYFYDGKLGVNFEDDIPTLSVWAPTAKSVSLHLYKKSLKTEGMDRISGPPITMKLDSSTGVWSIRGERGWQGLYYLYEVDVYVRQEGRLVRNMVTDPYSIGLAINSTHSCIIDLNNPDMFPDGWDQLTQQGLQPNYQRQCPTDYVLYELHVRDFSANDKSVPEQKRGTYLAFTQFQSNGMQHLKRIANAGITHVHMLPLFDFASLNENKVNWIRPDFELLSSFPPNSYKQQAILARGRGKDGYNWGYDPFHFMAPEGSYATNPDGEERILEFRQMVLSLNKIGLRLVMDMVFNHTYAAGQDEKSVLDRVVPGYYYRLDNDGWITNSTCCANTASEHRMMEKLMVDSVLLWATQYQVAGFRFDLMGHHMKSNILHIREALNALTPEKNKIDGKSIYMYGEGWDFGEVSHNARGVNATQWNMQGSGIGTFNDRLREAARGGGPFEDKQEQGFITGLYTDPNEIEKRPIQAQLTRLLEITDRIRIGLAGNLAEYELVESKGFLVSGAHIGQGCGYTRCPQENVVYVSAHDNETLFDAIQYKAPLTATMSDRVRMQNLAISLVALSQGVPFFDAGIELLHSKSLDRDSYDSGDWFNKIDFTYNTNNWGIGLPPQNKNEKYWQVMQDLLGKSELSSKENHIIACLLHFEEILRIRKSSPLFRLRYAGDVMSRVKFFNTGSQQIPGFIVMSISDNGPIQLDKQYDKIVVFFNANKNPLNYYNPEFEAEFELHPTQLASNDPVIHLASFDFNKKTFFVPGRTTAIFIHKRTH